MILTGVTARLTRLIELAGLGGVLHTTRLGDPDAITGLLAFAGG